MLKLFLISLLISVVASESNKFKASRAEGPVKPFDPKNLQLEPRSRNGYRRGSRISGGQAASDTQFPFINEINVFPPNQGYYWYCTGSFLTVSWVITVKHCMNTEDPAWYPAYVNYGSAIRSSSNRKNVGVDSYVWWPDANHLLDLAVVHISTPVQLNQFVGLAQIPPLSMENSHYEGYTVIQAGYGAGRDLQYQYLVMQPVNSGCLRLDSYNDFWGMCARPVGNSVAEGGDSGGPFFFYENGKPTVIGVLDLLSAGNHFATRLSSFIRTISDVVGIPVRP